ncbi:hypothetical protein GCM10009799_35170 [Nocardiopsis rhodophaea]|uniref:Uncharacterized protein n=1 Tax=Nocardiopsis rhodophaea TaxID=280238 RepID=A0ABP5EU10_9ACTN
MPVILTRRRDHREPIGAIGRGAAPETGVCRGVKIPLKPREKAVPGAVDRWETGSYDYVV